MSDLNRSIKIYIDGSEAGKGVKELENKIAGLEAKLSALNTTEANYEKKSARLVKEISAKNKTLADYNKKITETDRVLRNLSGATYNELLAVRSQINKELRNAIPGTEHYNQVLRQNREVTQQLTVAQKAMRVEVGCQATFWGRAAMAVNKYIAMGAAFVTGGSMLIGYFKRLAESAARMDDVYADVMKTTGLMRDEVVALNNDFKKLDTRTTREELNKLAADAGKLGITGRENLLKFVDAGNQIRVALGEDLGDDAIKNIGKITDVYRLSTAELDRLDLKGKMLAVGSAINELGQSSTAGEKYMVDFTKRLGGVASQAGISVQNILGYASALDQSGQAVEMSATSFQNFIMKLMEDPAKFARLAGEDVSEFTRLLETDTNAAIIKVLTSLNQKGGFQALIPVFNQMGMDGARAVGVLSSLATNIGMVTEAQEISNRAFTEATSISDEYQTKNNNLQALLQKAKNAYRDIGLEIGEALNPIMRYLIDLSTQGLKLLPKLIAGIAKYKTQIGALLLVISLYAAAKKTALIWDKALNRAKLVYRGTLLLVSAAYNILTGNITRASAALKAFNLLTKATPWGAILTAATAMGYAIYRIATRTDEAKEAHKAYTKELMKETTELDKLFAALERSTKGSDNRKKILEEINTKYKDYLPNLLNENSSLNEIKTAYEEINRSLRENIALKIYREKADEIQTESIEKQADKLSELREKVTKISPDAEADNVILNIKRWTEAEINAGKKGFETLVEVKRKLIAEYNFSENQISKFFPKLAQYINEVSLGYLRVAKLKDEMKPFLPEDSGKTGTPSDDGDDKNPDDGRIITPITVPEPEPAAKETKDRFKKQLQEEENRYKQRLIDLKKQRAEENMTEEEYNAALRKIDTDYYNDRLKLAGDFKAKVKKDETDRLDEISKVEIDAQNGLLKVAEQADKDKLKLARQTRDKELDEQNKAFEKGKRALQSALAMGYATQEEYDASMMILTLQNGESRVEINKKYVSVLHNLEVANGQLKVEAVKNANKDLLDAEREAGTARLNYETRLQNVLGNFKQKFGLLSPEEELKAQIAAVEASYKASLLLLEAKKKETGDETPIDNTELWEAKEKAITEIKKKWSDKRSRLESRSELQSLRDRFDRENKQLKKERDLNLISEAEYQKKLIEIKGSYALKYVSYYASLMSNAVNSMQQAELANLDAKYDVEIEAAKGNAEETERLENEKAQKKLEIQKKYADVSFAIKASQIIADTALSIIETHASLGGWTPWAIAAAIIMGVTGAAQLAIANAERQKVKNLTLSSGSSSSSPLLTGSRVVSQQAGGKYDVIGRDDGRLYKNVPYAGEARTGIVTEPVLVGEQGSELVVSSPDFRKLQKHINYPLVVQAINEARAGSVPQRATGKYDSIDKTRNTPRTDDPVLISLFALMKELKELLRSLKQDGINASVALSEFEKQQKRKEAAENPFTRKH